jgi:8-oxo-dGTP diphosphatase
MAEYVFEDNSPVLAVDVIAETPTGIILIERKYEPFGFAIPGGHVDKGESLENAARRELFEETKVEADFIAQFHAYSQPDRDPRRHVVSVVFLAQTNMIPEAADDAKKAHIIKLEDALIMADKLAFDHHQILADFAAWKMDGGFPPSYR